jgi:hypothetical protein
MIGKIGMSRRTDTTPHSLRRIGFWSGRKRQSSAMPGIISEKVIAGLLI